MKTLAVHTPPFPRWPTMVALSVISTLSLGGCGSGSSDDSSDNTDPAPSQLSRIENNEEFVDYLKEGLQNITHTGGVVSFAPSFLSATAIAEDALDAAAESDDSSGAAVGDSGSFSATNVIEQGVDEEDVVKYDGEILYVVEQATRPYHWGVLEDQAEQVSPPSATPGTVKLFQTGEDPTATTLLSVIDTHEEAHTITGIYLYGERDTDSASLITVSSKQHYGWHLWDHESSWFHGMTHIQVNDVSDPHTPTRTKDFAWEGHYLDSRRVDNTLYVLSRFAPHIPGLLPWPESDEAAAANQQLIDNASIADLLPTVSIDGDDSQPLVESTQCFLTSTLTGDTHGPSLIVITAINLDTLAPPTSLCTPAFNGGIYASTTALYFSETSQYFEDQRTAIHKFSIADTGVSYRGSGSIKGNLGWNHSGFRMSEYEDRLRVISTHYDHEWQPHHRLTVLEESDTDARALSIVSQLPNAERPAAIGKPGEEIYAVRFMGPKGYVVTFERIDPLYTLDLSDALAPRIAGELEIPGFSNYLQVLDDDTLLGIGIIDNQPQLSVFDVSDIHQPTLADTLQWPGKGTSITANNDYKALSYVSLPETSHTRFALPMTLRDSWTFVAQGAQLLTIDRANKQIIDNGFVTARDTEEPGYSYNKERTVIHDGRVHYIDDALVWSARWNNPDVVSGPVGTLY